MRVTLLRLDDTAAAWASLCLFNASRLEKDLPHSEQAWGRSSEWQRRWRDMCSCLLKPVLLLECTAPGDMLPVTHRHRRVGRHIAAATSSRCSE